MAKTPNYGQERAERRRTKERKQAEKLRRREADSLKRKAAREAQAGTSEIASAIKKD